MIKTQLLILTLTCYATFTFAQLTGYDLSNIVIDNNATNPIANIKPKEETLLTNDSTLNIVNWNVNWLGAPQMVNYKYGSRAEHINSIAAKLVEIDADIYALQEVVVDATNGDALTQLVAKMNALAGADKYAGSASQYHSFYWETDDPDFPPQCLAYIWNKTVVAVNKDTVLLKNTASNSNFGYGRLPYLLDAQITCNKYTQRYMFINIHLKASKGYSSQRAASMRLLKEMLEVNYPTNNVVILGDYNNADDAGVIGEITDWALFNDADNNGLADYVHAAGNKTNGIEHTLISNELFDELAYTPQYLRNTAISGTGVALSDHYAYQTRLYIHETNSGNRPTNLPLFQSEDEITMTASDYRTIVDYVKNDPSLSKLDHNAYADSEYYFGASAYYSNFDIRSGKFNTTFANWQEAVQTALAEVFLPQTYPNAMANAKTYTVNFATFEGTAGSGSFEFTCSQSAPNPQFQLSSLVANAQPASRNTIHIASNNNNVVITSDTKLKQVKVYSSTGACWLQKSITGHTYQFKTPQGFFLIIVTDINHNCAIYKHTAP